MRLRALFMPYALGVSAALALCLPFLQSGCGSTACIQLNAGDHGKCPSASAAFPRFSDPMCPGTITSVDGEGSLDGELCCYPVSQDSSTPFPGGCGVDIGGFSGTGNGGGFSTTASGFGTGGFGGTGGAGGGGPCGTCWEVLNGQFPNDPSQLCPASQTAVSDLTTCACNTGESCDTTCSDNLCAGTQPTGSCFSCISSDTACMAAFQECQAN
jgi:hypothetical protein